MRCPSCGNENPDDYTFCDECGARLQPQEGGTDAPAQAQEAVTFTPAGNAGAGPMDAGGGAGGFAPGPGPMDAMPASAATATADAPAPTSTGVCPSCGAPIVPGEAYCNECGAELTMAGADNMQPAAPMQGEEMGGMSAPPMQQEPVADAAAAGPAVEVPPVTEDTMPAAAPADFGPAEAMPGVMPAATDQPPVPQDQMAPADYASAAPAAPVATDAGAQANEWAVDALRQLEDAQQAMARGDFVAYGTYMSTLKAHLESAAQGAGPSMSGVPMAAAPSVTAEPVQSAPDAPQAAPVADEAAPPPLPAAPIGTPVDNQQGYQGAGMARLVVIATGAELPLPQQEEITVGREDPSSGIFPDIDLTPYGGEDGGVSRRHARMLHIGGDYFVEDLQSTNYTKLDGQRLPARVREKLEDGARLDFGRVAVIFRKG